MQILVTSVVGLCLMLGVHAQRPQFGFCNTYQTTQAFDEAFIAKMQENEEGYSFLLTSGPSYGCQKISFFPNGTFFYDFIDVANGRENTTGSYVVKPFSFTGPASITLSSLPLGELGSVLGTVNFNVLVAKEEFLVLLSCINIGFIRTQQVHVLIPESTSASVVAAELNTTVQEMQVPLASLLQEVQQTCDTEANSDEAMLLLNHLYTRLGFFPPSIPGNGFGGALNSGFYPFVINPNIMSSLSTNFAQQAQAGFPVYGSQSSLGGPQPILYSQAVSPSELQAVAPQIVGQQITPQPLASVAFGLQQFPNPTNVHQGGLTEAERFGTSSQFKMQAPGVATSFIPQAQQFQLNKPTGQVGTLQPGTYNTFY